MDADPGRGDPNFRALIERSADVYYHVRVWPRLAVVYGSPATEAMTGYPVEQWYAEPERLFVAVLHPAERRRLRDLESLVGDPVTLRWLRPDGSVAWIEQRNVGLRDETGRLTDIVGVARDMTAQREAETERDRMAEIVESTSDAIYSITRDRRIVTWNRGAERLYGYTAKQVVGGLVDVIVPSARAGEIDAQLAAIDRGELVQDRITQRRARDGRLIDVALTVSPMRDASGEIVGMSVIVRDVRDRIALQQRLQHIAEHDALTGLPNRRRFDEELAREVLHCRRHGRTGAVVLVDVDHFKFVNDSLGHAAGDDVLREVADALMGEARAGDVVARLGGDEFALLLRDTDQEAAVIVAERLVVAVRHGVTRVPVTATAGIAAFTGHDVVGPDEVLIAADIALYDAKQAGRDRARSFGGGGGQTLTWVENVRDAISRERFRLAAQPVVDLATGDVIKHELLLRMDDGDGNLVSPWRFLPTAERFGLMPDIDRWVVDNATELAAAGRPVSVNVSASSIGDTELADHVVARLAATGAQPADLIFEITETAAIGNLREAARFTDRLAAVGCSVALDDFGTGFGSLIYLKYLRVGYLKIDIEFVRDLAESDVDRQIVASIVAMAKGMGARTIAEGVEDARALDHLRELGVDAAQGYAIGEPVLLA